MKKTTKLFLCGINEPQISGFVVAKKAPSLWKKIFWKKKFFSAYLCGYDLQNGVRIFLKKINGSLDI